MAANRGRDTRPELAVRSAVHRLGLRFRVNARPITELRRTADLVFRRQHVAVFIDGCFWHGCPEHHTLAKKNRRYWSRKVEENVSRDHETRRVLEEAGWTVLRYWEHEDPGTVASAVARIVRP